MNEETAKAALSLLDEGRDFAWATIIDSRGSAPRHAGASMLVRADGTIAGTIGGGPLEATVIESALRVVKSGMPLMMDFDAARLGMMCGGGGLVLIEYVDGARETEKDLYRGLFELLDSGGRGWLVTVTSTCDAGTTAAGDATTFSVHKCLVRTDGSVAGDVVLPPEALRDLARRGGSYDLLMAIGGPEKTYVQPVGARGKAIVFGAGHCGAGLVPVLSSIGFFTTIVDDRADFANQERFPTADRVVVPESFGTVLETLPVDADTYLVIMTRGHQFDRVLLQQALRTPARYVGMMGSKKKVADTMQSLREQGFSQEELARAHAPIGVPIGGDSPEEIAISIAAELIQVRDRSAL
ncbi:MAG: XdhC family protein [Thermoleophilia bacterium]|nr:XdhC family protein [Thermoleophilia bacterium]